MRLEVREEVRLEVRLKVRVEEVRVRVEVVMGFVSSSLEEVAKELQMLGEEMLKVDLDGHFDNPN